MNSHLRIGPAVVLPLTRQVFVDGIEQRLGGRAFDLLLALARQPDGVISKESLYEAVWQDCAVEPNNLQVQVWALRRLLGERAIATVPRRGYRLALPVQVLAGAADRLPGLRDEAVRQWLVSVRERLQAWRWVTLVAADAAARRHAVQLVRTQLLWAAVPVWRWRSDARADAALWQRVQAVDGLILAEDLDAARAAALHAWHRTAPGAPRILASSAGPLPLVADTSWDVSTLTTLSPAGEAREPPVRQRTGLVRPGRSSAF